MNGLASVDTWQPKAPKTSYYWQAGDIDCNSISGNRPIADMHNVLGLGHAQSRFDRHRSEDNITMNASPRSFQFAPQAITVLIIATFCQ
eukprot:scaffold604264_cov43-Prasinocladus_malaysianus.AAC.1